MATDSEELITGGVAAELLNVTDETIRRWAEKGKIRHVKLPSGHRRYYRSDIAAILTPVEPVEAAS